MSEEKITIQSNAKKYIVYILVIFCFIGIPSLILSYSVYRYFQTDEEHIVFNLKTDMQRMTNELRRNILAETYFCRFFYEYYSSEINKNDSCVENCVRFCKKLKEIYKEKMEFVVITNSGEIRYNSNSTFLNYPDNVWYETYNYIGLNYNFPGKYKNIGNGLSSVRKVLGPQFVKTSYKKVMDQTGFSLMWVDSSGYHWPSAVYPMRWGGFFVYISKELLNDTVHLKNIIFDYANGSNIITGIYNNTNNNVILNKEVYRINDIKDALLKKSDGSNFIETEYYYICNHFLTNEIRSLAIARKKNTNFELIIKSFLVFIIFCLFTIPIIKYFWNTIVLNKPGNASISLKLGFLFIFATGIPLLSLFVVAHEYELYKRLTLIEEARIWSVENILGLEQRYLSFLKNICNDLDIFIDEWALGLKNKEITFDYSGALRKKVKDIGAIDLYCIASESHNIVTAEGLFRYSGSIDSMHFDLNNSELCTSVKDYRYNEIKSANIIIKKLCSDLNGKEMPSYLLSKIEVIAENILQKSFPEIIYTIVETLGIIKEWGFANKSNMTYFKFLSLSDKSITDYVILISWHPDDIQKLFVTNILGKANRNSKNFKFIAYERYDREFISPENYMDNVELQRLARRANEKPTEELETIKLKDEEYIAVSFLGRNLNHYSIIGLYPMRNIDNIINNQSFWIWLLGAFCLILSVGLAQLLTKSFVKPLLTLQDGALAIENRNFKHRVSNLNVDEFGEVGGIFNHVMVGLEELEVAKIVQESMFPQPEFNQGKFSIYGKSVTMIDVGGDYLDFFKIDDNSFAVLVGDVAGHGVGAAVIMAMAKASILGGGDALRSPAAILNKLHKMILATKSAKQRKIMTFQYLYVNSETGENLYGNAGACSPWLVRHSSNTIEEVKMAGATLGAFKKAVYKEMPLNIQPGDAMVFYTDGIVECKDKNGEMLGYERLKQLLLRCWDSNPENYYNNIYKAYIDYVGVDADAGDDLTFVILMYNQIDSQQIEFSDETDRENT